MSSGATLSIYRKDQQLESPNTITGTVTTVNVKGHGNNSSQLLFTVKDSDDGITKPFVAHFQPSHVPQVFAAYTTVVMQAYIHQRPIVVGYQKRLNETDRVCEIEIPPITVAIP